MKLDERYFVSFNFTPEQTKTFFENAQKDLKIAKEDPIPDVKFTYAYNALIKAGITLLGFYQFKILSVPGHHIKIIDALSSFLKDDEIAVIGNVMRSKRNLDLYLGGSEVSEKECGQYTAFVEKVLAKVKNQIKYTDQEQV